MGCRGPQLSVWSRRECCLKLHASLPKIAAQVEAGAQNRTGQLDCDIVLHRPSESGAAIRMIKGCVEIARAEIEHAQGAQCPYFLRGAAMGFCNCQASFQGCLRGILSSARKH